MDCCQIITAEYSRTVQYAMYYIVLNRRLKLAKRIDSFLPNTTETATPTLRTLFLIDDRFDLILFALLRFFLSSRFLSFFVSGGRYRNECSRKNSERGQGNLISRLALVALPKNEVVYLYTQFQFLRYYQFLQQQKLASSCSTCRPYTRIVQQTQRIWYYQYSKMNDVM